VDNKVDDNGIRLASTYLQYYPLDYQESYPQCYPQAAKKKFLSAIIATPLKTLADHFFLKNVIVLPRFSFLTLYLIKAQNNACPAPLFVAKLFNKR